MKLLLSSVFGPYGVDDDYGRRLNVMELFHNQVTREQGVFSMRMNHPSFGLYLIAENLQVPTTVLDFPTLDLFIQEARQKYDVIGISSIVANIGKVTKMVEVVRDVSPQTKVAVGGHCTGVRDIKQLTGADLICKGEGLAWFRELFNEEPHPFRHPAMFSTCHRRVLGMPLPNTAAVLIPGLGCVNACSFCATSHHFEKRYLGYMNTGIEVFEAMTEIEKKLGCKEFFVMDENFLKHRIRAQELLEIMTSENKYFYLGVFSSAETIQAVGVEFMAQLGIDFVWIGVESKRSCFTKTQGVDLKQMIAELRSYGIHVLGSAILFLDHHNPENIQEDIDFVIDLQTDFVQFMNLGPLPGTSLFDEMIAADRILHDLPFKEWHGQDQIWFRHNNFCSSSAGQITRDAFQQDYERQGPSLLRLADTALRGYRTARSHTHPRIAGLVGRLKERCLGLRPVLYPSFKRAENEKTRELSLYLQQQYEREFGKPNITDRLISLVLDLTSVHEQSLVKTGRNMRQPSPRIRRYRNGQRPPAPKNRL